MSKILYIGTTDTVNGKKDMEFTIDGVTYDVLVEPTVPGSFTRQQLLHKGGEVFNIAKSSDNAVVLKREKYPIEPITGTVDGYVVTTVGRAIEILTQGMSLNWEVGHSLQPQGLAWKALKERFPSAPDAAIILLPLALVEITNTHDQVALGIKSIDSTKIVPVSGMNLLVEPSVGKIVTVQYEGKTFGPTEFVEHIAHESTMDIDATVKKFSAMYDWDDMVSNAYKKYWEDYGQLPDPELWRGQHKMDVGEKATQFLKQRIDTSRSQAYPPEQPQSYNTQGEVQKMDFIHWFGSKGSVLKTAAKTLGTKYVLRVLSSQIPEVLIEKLGTSYSDSMEIILDYNTAIQNQTFAALVKTAQDPADEPIVEPGAMTDTENKETKDPDAIPEGSDIDIDTTPDLFESEFKPQSEMPEMAPAEEAPEEIDFAKFVMSLSPMDQELYQNLENQRAVALTEGNASGLAFIDTQINDLITKYQKPESFSFGPWAFQAFRNDIDEERLARFYEGLEKIAGNIGFAIMGSSLLKIDRGTDKYEIEASANINYSGVNRICMFRASISPSKTLFYPFVWSTLGRRYNLDEAGIRTITL